MPPGEVALPGGTRRRGGAWSAGGDPRKGGLGLMGAKPLHIAGKYTMSVILVTKVSLSDLPNFN